MNAKNEEIEKHDRIIEGLQEKLSKLEKEGNLNNENVLVIYA